LSDRQSLDAKPSPAVVINQQKPEEVKPSVKPDTIKTADKVEDHQKPESVAKFETNQKSIPVEQKKEGNSDKPAVDSKPIAGESDVEKNRGKDVIQVIPTASDKVATEGQKTEHDHNIGNGSKNQLFIVEGFHKMDESLIGMKCSLSSE
jgi:hypothetical protein